MRLFLVLAILLVTGQFTMAAQPSNSQDGEILLEEVEFIIMDGDKVKESTPMRERDSHERGSELRKRGLPPGQRLMSKRLKNPRLRFVDKAGKTKKEVPLGTLVLVATMPVEGSTVSRKVEYFGGRSAHVSHDGSLAAIWEAHGEPAETGDGRESGSWYLADRHGNRVWEKTLPRFKAPRNCKISADNSVIVVAEAWTRFHQLDPSEPLEQIVIHDNSGRELFRFPKSRADDYRLYSGTDDIEMSPKGRYIAIRARKGKSHRTVFIDVQSRATWDFEKESYPVDIDDSGKARVGLMVERRVETLDLAGRF